MTTVAAQTRRNGVDVTKLFATLDAVKAHPEAATFRFGVNNRWLSGTHNRNEITTFYGVGAGLPCDGAEQARLADACLTRDEQQPAFARRGGGEPVLDQGEERVPADQDRRLDAPASPHDAPPPT